MLSIFIYIVVAIALAIGLLLAIASRKPDQFRTARTLRIAATPDRLFGLINNLRQMNSWNPYALRETAGTTTYSGPEAGSGAHFDFAGPKSGSGFIEILESTAPTRVVMRLAMHKPMKADNRVEFSVNPVGNACDVTWAMSGGQPLMMKAMGLLIDCDKMVGRDFEQGLANLKAIAETP